MALPTERKLSFTASEIDDRLSKVAELEELIKNSSSSSIKDWNVNDETDPAYIQNRPFYTTDPQLTTVANIAFTGSYAQDRSYIFTKENTYTVIYNGTTYADLVPFEYTDDDTLVLYIGDRPETLGTNYPFCIEVYPEYGELPVFYNTTSNGDNTFEIKTITSTNIQLDEKYISYVVGRKNADINGAEIFNDYAKNVASGSYSHAEGNRTTASGNRSHAEGHQTTASGHYGSHAEGAETIASGEDSHAEGYQTKASSSHSHAEGYKTMASGTSSHAEGHQTKASSDYSHAEGYHTTAFGDYSHAEGLSYKSIPDTITSSSTNDDIITAWENTSFSLAKGEASHVEGQDTLALGWCSHAEGERTTASANDSHAEGYQTKASGIRSHAEGSNTKASGRESHAEGSETEASGKASHVEGYFAKAIGDYSHAEGEMATASGNHSHAEGSYTTASGDYSHAEGSSTTASSDSAHAEGFYTTASGHASHAEGYDTTASGIASHAEGEGTAANHDQHVQGKNNVLDGVEVGDDGSYVSVSNPEYAHIVGNGNDRIDRSNAHTLDWDGNAWFAGDVYVGSTSGINKDEGSKKLISEAGGTLEGALIAGAQTESTSLLRNSKLVSVETNPTVNGEICWTYE